MYYCLLTEYNENGRKVIVKKKIKGNTMYEIFDFKGIRYSVDKEWLLFHQNSIVNLGIKTDNRFYVKNDFTAEVWNFWQYNRGYDTQGKMTISKVLREFELEDLQGLKNKGYDSIIIKNAPVGIRQKRLISREIIVFKPSQIKSIYNYKPKRTDSLFDGFEIKENVCMITEEQEKYFRYSKIKKPQNGKPKVCYHATNEVFDSFDISRVGEGGGSSYGNGFYFSSEPIEEYGKVMEVFLDARKPYVIENVNDFGEVLEFLKVCKGI